MTGRRVSSLACALFLIAACTGKVDAGFISGITGAAVQISPPASADAGVLESDSYLVWEESSGTLSADLQLNHGGQSGDFDGLSNFAATAALLSAGTAYASTLIHLDAKTAYPAQQPIASITFSGKIIGMALFRATLEASDVYGNPLTTVYPSLPDLALQNRGIDAAHNDRFSISADGRTLSLQLTSGIVSIDQIRVFTTPTDVPEPSSLVVWSVVGLFFGLPVGRVGALRRYSSCGNARQPEMRFAAGGRRKADKYRV